MSLKALQAIFFFLLPGMGLFAQSAAPEPLELPRYQNRPPNQLLSGTFYPIGFSQTGKFAYAIAPADEACGCYFFEFRIQDLVTDELVYRYDYRGDTGPKFGEYENLDDLWAAKYEVFMQEMRRYEISRRIPAFDSSLAGFQVLIAKREFLEADLGNMKFIRSAGIEIRNSLGGKKTVANLQFDKQHVQQIEAIGYFKSPYEDRIALLFARIDRGWEGLPQVLDYEVIGVHQSIGFR